MKPKKNHKLKTIKSIKNEYEYKHASNITLSQTPKITATHIYMHIKIN